MRGWRQRDETIHENRKTASNVLTFEKARSFLFIFFNGSAWHARCLQGVGVNSRMTSSSERARKRRRRLMWEVLSIFVISLLQLCTFSPRVHADLIHQPAHAHHISATEHCASPPLASQSTAPLTEHHKPTTEPVCCSLVGAQKGRIVVSVQSEFLPVLWPFHLSFDSEPSAWRVWRQGVIQTLYTLHCPSLYLLHTLLLI